MGLTEYALPRGTSRGSSDAELVLIRDDAFRHQPTHLVIGRRDPVLSYDLGTRPQVLNTNWVNLIPGVVTLPLADEARPDSSSWLSELREWLGVTVDTTPSAVGQQIAEIQRITGWSDERLAAAFPGQMARETINRWRNRPDPNLREENLYRLGVLYQLAQRLEAVGVDARVWLNQPSDSQGGETPYALICSGRLAEVRQAVELIAVGSASANAPMAAVTVSRERDVVPEEDDDEGDVWDFVDVEEELDE